jgi:hypothetical protein
MEEQQIEENRYTSRWLNDMLEVYADGGDWEDMVEILKEVDGILVEILASTDSYSILSKVKGLIFYD